MSQIPSISVPPLDAGELRCIDAWWRAANYLNVGQFYLSANPLLREPLTVDHIKPRLLGHWGTSPGLNLIYVHMNRLIRKYDLDAIYMAGPGHGGPALIANVWLEGSYTDFYPAITRDEPGMLRLFRQFSTPGGVPSHVSVPTPGSIHEGGELGYVLLHAFGAVMDNPDLLVTAVVGDGESETGPLAGSWKSIDFINPTRDGAVLPILHLNGYKISGPTVWARHSDADLTKFFEGQGYEPHFVEGDDPAVVHQQFAEVLETTVFKIRAIQADARKNGLTARPCWPMIVLRTPKGWTGPKVVDGVQIEGTFRAHQVPVSEVRTNPEHLRILEDWMRSYRPEELFDEQGRFREDFAALAPDGARWMGSNPSGQWRPADRAADIAGLCALCGEIRRACPRTARLDGRTRRISARHLYRQPGQFPAVLPGRDQFEPARRGVRHVGPLPGQRDRAGRRSSVA